MKLKTGAVWNAAGSGAWNIGLGVFAMVLAATSARAVASAAHPLDRLAHDGKGCDRNGEASI